MRSEVTSRKSINAVIVQLNSSYPVIVSGCEIAAGRDQVQEERDSSDHDANPTREAPRKHTEVYPDEIRCQIVEACVHIHLQGFPLLVRKSINDLPDQNAFLE